MPGTEKTPTGMRPKIGLFGRRNVGKSSLLNKITRQETSIVSDTPGTTTDTVQKTMELLPLGPVVFVDTAGLDDTGSLGEERIRKTKRMVGMVDVAVLVAEADLWDSFEEDLLREFDKHAVPVIVALNKKDRIKSPPGLVARLHQKHLTVIETSTISGKGIKRLREELIRIVPDNEKITTQIVADIVAPGNVIILVTPIDTEAPKGRLILPQVQTLRDLLDNHCIAMVVREHELEKGLASLCRPPSLVITDSQAFEQVNLVTPPEVFLTSFSILFARLKGDLQKYVQGAEAIDRLETGDRVLIAEACNHHPTHDDIGTIKIPRWLKKHTGKEILIDHVQGQDFPEDIHQLSIYKLVIQCGGCMLTRRQVLWRQRLAEQANVPMTNYGIAIAQMMGILPRALQIFQNINSSVPM